MHKVREPTFRKAQIMHEKIADNHFECNTEIFHYLKCVLPTFILILGKLKTSLKIPTPQSMIHLILLIFQTFGFFFLSFVCFPVDVSTCPPSNSCYFLLIGYFGRVRTAMGIKLPASFCGFAQICFFQHIKSCTDDESRLQIRKVFLLFFHALSVHF